LAVLPVFILFWGGFFLLVGLFSKGPAVADSDGEIPGVTLLPVPWRGQAVVLRWLPSAVALVPAARSDGCPAVLTLEGSVPPADEASGASRAALFQPLRSGRQVKVLKVCVG